MSISFDLIIIAINKTFTLYYDVELNKLKLLLRPIHEIYAADCNFGHNYPKTKLLLLNL